VIVVERVEGVGGVRLVGEGVCQEKVKRDGG